MKNNIIFSKITADDWPQIMAIENQTYPNPWPLKVMQDCQQAGYQCIKGTVSTKPNEIACYAFLMIGFEESNLLNISVNPVLQRQNIASQLLQRLLLISRINHAKNIWLEVRASNQAAINLYEKFHFKQIGTRKHYYQYIDASGQKIKEHALIMSRKVNL
ncbi:ribosomal protein S18-alanine N-acetyltransferase [Marinicella sp. S1101]|uniref:ribosomal protein S18-alanine N-acetyltransferase n=1 Tax=Marinicella marina TaxID=2996016 RepID=UPI002260D86D|nr:ribosomal protein S18-alanine N-acetyltransferase [Marinicella marina]MCX7552467.1 ribosomal protein S18-alanine N-acetyltransferase [Marinicella marina]MDJ1139343.1 ribosomal protein S18-alanine N-acetyltransferase [Marinicella marina]